jgi:hypothetical protein
MRASRLVLPVPREMLTITGREGAFCPQRLPRWRRFEIRDAASSSDDGSLNGGIQLLDQFAPYRLVPGQIGQHDALQAQFSGEAVLATSGTRLRCRGFAN